MYNATKAIKDATGLNVKDFCEQYLGCKMMTFQMRLRKKALYPNEYALICLLTGKTTEELFGANVFELFFLRGKKKVSAHVKDFLSIPENVEKINMLFNSDNGIRIVPPKKIEIDKKVLPKTNKIKKRKEKVSVPESIESKKLDGEVISQMSVLREKVKDEPKDLDFSFVNMNL